MDELQADMKTLESAMHLFFQTMKRPQRWASLQARAQLTIDRPGAVILQVLAAHTGAPYRVHDLAQQLSVEAPSVTRKTQELEIAGYLHRVRDVKDKRVVSLELTAEGTELAHRIRAVQREAIESALRDWPPADRRAFVALFERFSADLANTSFPTTSKKERI